MDACMHDMTMACGICKIKHLKNLLTLKHFATVQVTLVGKYLICS